MIYRYLFLQSQERYLTRGGYHISGTLSDTIAILRTNRQIYTEAISVLYNELAIILEPGDISCLGKSNERSGNLIRAKADVWRHHPLYDPGHRSEGAEYGYNTLELGGLMEPHIFARFTKIRYSAEFELMNCPWPLGGDDEMILDLHTHDPIPFSTFLQTSSIMKLLVQLFSHSPCIRSFSFILSIYICEEYAWDDVDRVSNARALEMFMESGILEPLQQLSNVQTFGFEFDMMEEGRPYQPLPKYRKMAQDLKYTIEGKWRQDHCVAFGEETLHSRPHR